MLDFFVSKRVKMSSVRDTTPNRNLLNGGGTASPVSIVTMSHGDAAIASFTPHRNSIHLAVPTAARAWTILETGLAASYDLKLGEGFSFWVQNDSAGANTITLTVGGGAGQIAKGAGTFTIAQATTRHFLIVRTGASTHTIYTTGTATH